MREALQQIVYLRAVIILLLLTNVFTLAIAAAAMLLRDGERLRTLARRRPA